jgi:hypothetical protein
MPGYVFNAQIKRMITAYAKGGKRREYWNIRADQSMSHHRIAERVQ